MVYMPLFLRPTISDKSVPGCSSCSTLCESSSNPSFPIHDLFSPSDFTFVCPTEILAFNDALPEFARLNTAVVGTSPAPPKPSRATSRHANLTPRDTRNPQPSPLTRSTPTTPGRNSPAPLAASGPICASRSWPTATCKCRASTVS